MAARNLIRRPILVPASYLKDRPMMRLVQIVGLAALIAAPGFAHAATPNPTDKTFLIKDAQGGAYELASAKLATDKASRDAVKSYAQKLVSDHEQLNAALEKLGTDQGVQLPTDMTSADKKRLAKLEALSGPAFDKAYVAEAIRINTDDKHDAQKEQRTTKNEAIKSFIQQFAAMDDDHEKMARELKAGGS